MARKPDWLAVLADNLRRFMQAKGIKSDAQLERMSGVAQKTISNIKNSRHDPYFSSIKRIASALGVEPYQMLIPVEDEKYLALSLAWGKISHRGRELILAAAEAAARMDDAERQADTTVAQRTGVGAR